MKKPLTSWFGITRFPFGIVGIVLFFVSIGLWIPSLPFTWTGVLNSNSFLGVFLRIVLSVVGLALFFFYFRKRERFLPSFQAEGLEVTVSIDVFKRLLEKVLEGFDGVKLDHVTFKKSNLSGVTDLIIELKVGDPFSLSEVLKEIYQKTNSSIRESIGDLTGLRTLIKVRGFEVRGENV